jgi:Ca2+-binding RTX toxin-like protein
VTLPTLLDGGRARTIGIGVSLDNAPNDAPDTQSNVHDDVECVLGGPGNDTLVGSFFPNILVGNAGNDAITDGGGGRDVMIGGTGADVMAGNGSDDLRIAARTAYDASFTSLLALRGAWASSSSYSTRVSQLKAGVSGVKIASSTVFNDSAIDALFGGTAGGWFVINAGDTVKDRSSSETVTTL